jgi:diaminohydroxyphosphoribosylaminopyrimidine deaminase/5-amino-6-(5-phosphoribosylamino)uracil reductase
MVFIAPKLIGGRMAKTPVEGEGFRMVGDAIGLYRLSHETIGEDVLITAYTNDDEW